MATYKVQKLVALKGKPAAGQASASIGAVWQTIARKPNKAVAETIARHARIDNPKSQIRVTQTAQ
jgi:hypothetical protein